MSKSILRRVTGALVVGALLSLSLQGCITTDHQSADTAITPFGTSYEVFLRAERKMQELIEANPDTMPRLSDKGVSGLFDILTDKSRAYGSAAFPVDFNQPVCPTVTRLSSQYMTHMDRETQGRLDRRRDQGLETKSMVIQAVNENTLRYDEELFALQDFGIRCMAESTVSAMNLVSSLPASEMTEARRNALTSSRQSAVTIINSTLLITADPKVNPTLAKSLLFTLTQSAPKLVSGLNLRQRTSLIRQVSNPRHPYPFYGLLLAQTIDSAPCGPICQKY